jgi:hypothetical protein
MILNHNFSKINLLLFKLSINIFFKKSAHFKKKKIKKSLFAIWKLLNSAFYFHSISIKVFLKEVIISSLA